MNCKPDVNHSEKVVPEGGFEPPTRGFSILAPTLKNNDNFVNRGENGAIGINTLENGCKPNNAQIIAELNRVKCEFQLRTILAVMGVKP